MARKRMRSLKRRGVFKRDTRHAVGRTTKTKAHTHRKGAKKHAHR